jgi:lysyl-tRNA synthetase class 2
LPLVTEPSQPPATADELPEQMRVRREKLDRLRAEGIDPYPPSFARTTSVAELAAAYPDLAPDTATGTAAGVAGRVVRSRNGGKLCFATIRDGSGDLQVMLSLDRLGAESLARWKADVDLGDQIGVVGEVIASRSGELSVLADSWIITAKALRPLPDKHKGLADPEARVRQRYVDLIVNTDARSMVYRRAAILSSVRSTLERFGYVEVETPILQTLHGGAAARPFATRLNAFDLPMYLRIAIELYLKRLVVGGIERVYEIGRIFRNEGVDTTHSPEFTMLEAYEAYGDYDTMATLTRAIVLDAAAAIGSAVVPDGRGGEIDLAAPWRSVTVHDAVSGAVGEQLTIDTPAARLRVLAENHGVALQPHWGHGEIVLELFEKLVEHTLIEPTFVRDYPVSVRPRARPHQRSAIGRSLGSCCQRRRVGARLFRTRRPGRATPSAHRAISAGGRRRSRSHATRRGFPARPRIWSAAHGRARTRNRPVGDVTDGFQHPRDDSVSVGSAGIGTAGYRSARAGVTARIRRARTSDVAVIRGIVDAYARDRILLDKPTVTLYEDIQEFWVAEDDEETDPELAAIGCGALHVLWEDLAEVRTLAVRPDHRGVGVGHLLLDQLIQVARDLGVRRLFCLTFQVTFFKTHGFRVIEGSPVAPDVYEELLRSYDEGVAEFLGLERVKPNTLGNTRMLLQLQPESETSVL